MKNKLFKFFSLVFLIVFIPVINYADDDFFDEYIDDVEILQTIEASTDIDKEPQINARHAVVFDRASKTAIYGKKESEQCKMASTTKIMTAIVVIENSNLSDTVTISSKAAHTGGSRLGLSTDDTITVENLLYGLMMKSGNDAAVALAEYVAGNIEGFATLMNQKASELNLQSTHFVTPHGLDNDEHYTTALDLAVLTDYALENETFAKIVKTKTYTVIINGNPKTINNTNELLGNFDGVYGVKTGFTNGANRCLVTSCKRGDLDIICVVLGCDTKKDRTKDSVRLLNYVFNNFSLVNVEDFLEKDFENWYVEHKNSFTINKGVSQTLNLYLNKNNIPFSHIAVKKSEIPKLYTDISFTSYFEAPVTKDSEIGKITLKLNDKEYFSVKILSDNTIDKKNSFNYLIYIFKYYFNFFNQIVY